MKDMKFICWERILDDSEGPNSVFTERAKIKGGWLVRCGVSGFLDKSISITFVPDENHEWEADLMEE